MWQVINIILAVIAIYLMLGFLFAIAFVIKGVNVVDEGAHGSTIGFRIIIIPGTIALWPVLLRKWMKTVKDKNQEINNTRRKWDSNTPTIEQPNS